MHAVPRTLAKERSPRTFALRMLLPFACCFVLSSAQAREGKAPVPSLATSISVDGPPATIQARRPGQLVRLRFKGRAGQRIGVGLGNIRFVPESASSLVVTLRDSHGGRILGSRRLDCLPRFQEHQADTCGASFTLPSAGMHTIEVDTPFSATARFTIELSTPAEASLVVGHEQAVEVKRIGQDARFRIRVTEQSRAVVNVRDVSPGSTGTPFHVNLFRPDGVQLDRMDATPERGASLHVRSAGDYVVEVEPANGKPGVFAASARTSPKLSLDGPPAEFATNGPNEDAWIGLDAHAGENVVVTMDGLAHHPEVDSKSYSRISLLAPDGTLAGVTGCYTHGTPEHPPPLCQFFVNNLPESGPYAVSVSPPAGAAVSGRVLVAHMLSESLVPGAPVAVGPMKPGQVVRYTFAAEAGQPIHIALSSISTSPPGKPVYLFLRRAEGEQPEMSLTAIATTDHVALEGLRLPAAGKYVVIVDPAAASLQSAQLSVVLDKAVPPAQ